MSSVITKHSTHLKRSKRWFIPEPSTDDSSSDTWMLVDQKKKHIPKWNWFREVFQLQNKRKSQIKVFSRTPVETLGSWVTKPGVRSSLLYISNANW